MHKNDPIGKAIQYFKKNGESLPIQVESDLMEKDIIPVAYLFRSFDMMPKIEQHALNCCEGKILDIGAGAGPHTRWLREKGFDVTSIDTSSGAIEYLNQEFPKSQNLNKSVLELKGDQHQYDTLLLLMNGIGLAGNLAALKDFLLHLKSLLSEGGKILCDSTDVKYFYQEDDGGMWVDLNTEYHGNFKFNMKYEEDSSGWFDWLYVDPETLNSVAAEAGLIMKLLISDEHSYLAELTHQ